MVKKRVPIILPEPHNCISMPISFMLFNSIERVTGDVRFIEEVGSEVVFETAKILLSYGDFIEKTANLLFCINGVTGPDEYSALVNNNFYTNKMAQNNLYYAIELAKRYEKHMELIDQWQQAADPSCISVMMRLVDLPSKMMSFLNNLSGLLKRHQR